MGPLSELPQTLVGVREFAKERGGRVLVHPWGPSATRTQVIVSLGGYNASGLTGERDTSWVPMADRVDEVARACLHRVWEKVRAEAKARLVEDATEMLVARR